MFASDQEVEVELLVANVCEGGSRGGHPRGSNGGPEVAVCEGNMVTTQRNGRDLPASPRFQIKRTYRKRCVRCALNGISSLVLR